MRPILHGYFWVPRGTIALTPPFPAGPIATPLSAQAAADARDSMAKVVYARLFDWLVSAINAAVDEAHNGASGGGSGGGGRHLSIGLLDIYGFESFKVRQGGFLAGRAHKGFILSAGWLDHSC